MGPGFRPETALAAARGKPDALLVLRKQVKSFLKKAAPGHGNRLGKHVPQRLVFFIILTQNLTQNRKNWGGAESTQPPGFGLFRVTKLPENVEPQQMDKPTAAHNPEVGGSSPPPATRNPLESPDFSGLFLFLATFL